MCSMMDGSGSQGSVTALNIAFTNLKHRYLQKTDDLTALQKSINKPQKTTSDTTAILNRRVEQLQKTLSAKQSAYKDLENMYFQLRQSEDFLSKYSQETEQLFFSVLEKFEVCQQENCSLKKENAGLIHNLEITMKQNEKSGELQEILSSKATEVTPASDQVLQDSCALPNMIQMKRMQKQIDHLLQEKKTLRTNMYWLSVELTKERQRKHSSEMHEEAYCLEEGVNETSTMKPKVLQNSLNSVLTLREDFSLIHDILKKNSEMIDALCNEQTERTNNQTNNRADSLLKTYCVCNRASSEGLTDTEYVSSIQVSDAYATKKLLPLCLSQSENTTNVYLNQGTFCPTESSRPAENDVQPEQC